MQIKGEHMPEREEHKKDGLQISNDGWGNGLGARTAKNAVKTVFFNFREYVSFFVVLFIIQSMFWLLCFTTTTNVLHEHEEITELYDYHLLIDDISQPEMVQIDNALVIKSYQEIRSFEEYKFLSPDAYNESYRLKVVMREGSDAQTFIDYYINATGVGEENVRITYTPLYTYMTDYIASNITVGILLAVMLTLLSSIILMALYNVRINHYKFLYGIYMTCGAGFNKLFSTAICEMMVISITTLMISLGLTYVVTAVMYSFVGTVLSIYWWMIPIVIVLNLLTVYISVRAPMKHMSKKAPISLIVANDNSNLVTSPRRSFRIFNKSFPLHYELFGAWRFRKYLFKTLLTAVLFASLFVCGIYLSHMKQTAESVIYPEFTVISDIGEVSFDNSVENDITINDIIDIMDEAQADGIESIEGVNYALWRNETAATRIISHCLISSEQMAGGAEYSVICNVIDGYSRASNVFNYTAFDKHYIDTICKLYDVSGDPYAILDDEYKIIVSDSILNKKCFDFIPGDKIYLAKYIRANKNIDRLFSNDADFLRAQLENYEFEYIEYEIAAVIHDGEASERFLIGMNYDAYYRFTGTDNISPLINVWLNDSVDVNDVEDIHNNILISLDSYLGDYFIDYSVTQSFSTIKSSLMADRCSYVTIIIIAVMMLMLSPVVWFFSQILFYKKRSKEIEILRVFGAKEKSLRGIYIFAGLIMVVVAVIMTVLLSLILNFGTYKLFNEWLPAYGFTNVVNYDFYVSVVAIVISIAVSVICGFLSSYIPYKLNKNQIKSKVQKERGNI